MPTTLARPRIATRRPRQRQPLPVVPAEIQHFTLDRASWALYELLLKEVGGQAVRITYDRGRMEVMSPLPAHERPKRAIGRLIRQITL